MKGINFVRFNLADLPGQKSGYCLDGYVYLLGHDGMTKIGMTRDPMLRIKGLIRDQRLTGITIYLSEFHEFYAKNEKLLHKQYRKDVGSRSREWFNIDIEHIDKIYPDLEQCKPKRILRKTERSSLRDEFAMAALTGMLAHHESLQVRHVDICYEVADAMLKAREVKS